MKLTTVLFLGLLMLATFGCGDDGQTEQKTLGSAEEAAALDQGPRAAETMILVPALAERGATLFDDKSCSDCHSLGEADMAPNLLGVLDRRTQKWLTKKIHDPEWMSLHDPISKGLIEEFDLEMVGMETSEAEAEALLNFLLRESGMAGE